VSSAFLHLPRNDVDNDISQGNVFDESRDIERDLESRSSKNRAEEIGDDPQRAAWLQRVSESFEAKSRSSNGEDGIALEERTLLADALEENGSEHRGRSSTIYPRPTTMRGIPLAELISSSQPMTRGFYLTRSENDLPTTPTQIPANNFTTYHSSERTETTLISDVSTSGNGDDDIVTVNVNARGNGRHGSDTDANSIEEDLFLSSLSGLSLKDSNDAENLSDFSDGEIDAVTTLVRPAAKRGKSLRNFDELNKAASPQRNVIPSSTTPTRRKIALVVSRYNEAITPLWTGKRIVVRKRKGNTLSPIKQKMATTRSESDFREAFGTSVHVSSTPISRTRKLSETTTQTLTAMPTIASTKSTELLSEASCILGDSTDFIDRTVQDSEKRTEATIGLTDPIFPTPKRLASTANSDATTDVASSTSDTDDPAVANAIMTTSPAVIAVADAFATTSDHVTTTASFAIDTDAAVETTNSQIVRYSSAITLTPRTEAKMNSIAYESTATTTYTAIASRETVPTIANRSQSITVNPINVNAYESAIDPTIAGTTLHEGDTSTTIETTHATTNYPSIVIPTIRENVRTATTISPIRHSLPLTATVTSVTNTRDTIDVSATTRDLVNVNSDATQTTDTTTNTITPAYGYTVIADATTTDPNVMAITDADVSLAITPASVDTLTTVAEIDSATFEPLPVTKASLAVSDHLISSTETKPWTIPSTILELSSVFDIDEDDERSSVSTTTEPIGITTELDTTSMFETSRTWRASPTMTTMISRSPSDPETSTIVDSFETTDSFPIRTNDHLTTSMPDAQTLHSIPISITETADWWSATDDGPLIATHTVRRPSTTSWSLDSVGQTTDKKATLSETNAKKGLEKAATSTIAQDSRTDSPVRSRKVTDINETDSLQTAKEERTKVATTVAETASRNAQNRHAENQTAYETKHDTNDHAFAREASERRVLNRANNWIGRPLAEQSIDHSHPRRRVTVHRHRGRSRRPSEYISSSKVAIEESRRGKIAQTRVRVKAINDTVRPGNIPGEDIVHGPATNVTRRIRVTVKRIREKLMEENASVSSVRGTTVLESSADDETRLQPRRENENIERRRQVAAWRRSRSRSREEATTSGGIGADSDSKVEDENLQNGSRSNLRLDKTFIPGERRRGLVLKSVRRKSEQENIIERATADSDHADKSLPSNDSHVGDNLSGKGNATRKRVRVVLKSVKPRSEIRDVTIEEADANVRFHPTDASYLTPVYDNFRTSENLEEKEREGKTRRRMRIVLKRVKKPKLELEEKMTAGEAVDADRAIDESIEKTSNDRHESENLSSQYGETKVVSKDIDSKSEVSDSTEGRSEHPLDEEAAMRDQMEAVSDSIEPIKFPETDSVAEETNFNFAIEDPRVIFPFNFSNNLRVSDKTVSVSVRNNDSSNNLRMDDESSNVKQTREEMESSYKDKGTMIEQSERFDTDLRTESVTRIEEDTDRLSLEVSVVLNIEDPLLDNIRYTFLLDRMLRLKA